MSALLPQFLCILIIVGFKPIYGQTCTTHSKTLPVALAAHEAIYSSHTKKAYIFGGDETESNIYKWDLSGAFQTIGSIPQSAVRFYTWSHNAVLIGNIIWFIGMRIKSSYETDLIFKYNVITEQWEDTSNLLAPPVSLSYGCLATDETHIFLVDGKSDNQARNPRVLQIYNIANNQWTTHATPYDDNGQYEWFYQYCHVVNNELFVLGGMLQYSNGDSTDLRDIFKYNRQLNQWTKLPVLLPNGWGSYHGKTVLYNDVLYMIGDIWVGNDAIKAFNTNTQTFDEITLRQDCDSPGIIVVDNVIYVFGGRGIGGQYLTNIEYCTLPTKEPTADPVPPTKKPSPQPTPAPTPAPTKRPSPQPTPAPNKQPTGIPTTAAPSPAPTFSPTTPSPTQPPPLPCGGETVGYYSSGQLVFEMTMTFTGDIIFDASNSNFAIAEIQALTALGNSLGSDSDGDGVVTLSQAIASDYKFVMVGEATGVYHVKIQCVSDSPTKDPTTPPVNHPITAHPTRRPSLGPFVSPVTSEPTTAMPTVLPSKRPTPLVTTKRPIATVADTTEDSNDNDEREDEVQGEAEPSDVRIAVYILCGLIICCVCLCGLFVYKHCLGVMIRKKTGDRGMGRPQAEIDCERNLVMQWLRHTVKLPQYMDKFVTNGYDNMRAIQLINSKEELARCGIEMPGHQTLILAEIYKARGLVSSNVVNKPMIEMREMGRGLENGEVNGEGVLIGHATRESLSDSRFDATFVHATVTHGTDEVPPAANAPLVLDIPQPPQDPEDAMTVEGRT